MARIGLIEIKNANHELAGICQISNTAKNQVTVFTTHALYPQVKTELHGKTDEYEWIFENPGESTYSYLKRIERICSERIDMVIIKSCRNWLFMFFNPRSKVLSFVSNLNRWFRDIRSPSIILKKMMDLTNVIDKRLITNAITGPIVRNIILSHLDGVIVEYPPFKDYIRDNFSYKGKVYFFPNRPFTGLLPQLESDRIAFVIPGRIQELRRDYITVISVFENLFPKYGNSIELHLVGEPIGEYAEKIITRCIKLKDEGYAVSFPRGYVSATLLENTIFASDVIISPIQVGYRSSTVNETYTITKGTGIFSDTIKYAKPAIVPNHYRFTDEIRKSFLTYKDENELQTVLENLIEDRHKLDDLKQEAINTSERFSLAKLHESFDYMVEDLLGDVESL